MSRESEYRPEIEVPGSEVESSNKSQHDPLGILENSEENQEGKEKINWTELFKIMDEKIMERVAQELEMKDEIIEKFLKEVGERESLGETGAILFNQLAKHGLAKVDKEHSGENNPASRGVIIESYGTNIDELKKSLSAAELENFLSKIVEKEFEPVGAMRKQNLHGDSGEQIEQLFFQVASAENSDLLIEEFVKNYLNQSNPDLANFSVARLRIKDRKSHKVLDLGQLLPKDFIFRPAHMFSIKEDIDQTTGKSSKYLEKVDLNTYEGTQKGTDEFYENPSEKSVSYGNLSKKGGRISLLHEIAHAWQSQYHSTHGKLNFNNFFQEVTRVLENLNGNKPEDWSEELWQRIQKFRVGELKEFGVEVNLENLEYKGQLMDKGEYKISKYGVDWKSSPLEYKKLEFVVRSDKIKPLVEDFVRQERDAWAHALRALRFFRKQGIDLEPEMKTKKDIEDYVHNCLGSYQYVMESRIDPTKHIKKFTNKSRFKVPEPEEPNASS